MHIPQFLHRCGRTKSRPAPFVSLLVGGSLIAASAWTERTADAQFQIPGFGGRWQPGDQDPVAGVYLPTDRALSRAVARARERLADHEYHEALAFLHGILGRDEDSFLERTDGVRQQLGLKATARQLIGELPPEGREAYELLHGATARRQLEAALRAGDEDGVANVVRRFFHTSAGYEAALVLAQMEADQGHRLAAVQLYQELIDTPRAADRFEPQLSVLAAINQMSAGEREAAATTLRSLLERRPATEVVLSGRAVMAPAAGADLIAWLAQFVGEPSTMAASELNWLSARGDPARNARAPGGRPHLRARWQARVVNDPAVEAYLSARGNDFTQRGVAVLPSAGPIAVGDVVVMRTPENVVAVDWQTGKRVWETRDDQELEPAETTPEFAPGIDNEQLAGQDSPLEQRVWDDALVASLSSDGERVFVLRGGSAPDEEQQIMGWQMAPGFGRIAGEVAATTNQLAAYDIATQGKLVWELDGSRAAAPLDGAFFLGAPLAIDNTLYVMAEIRSAVYLLALNPATGEVRWQQQLLGLEQGISLDPIRRRAGAMPSYAGGILICPTAASTVVAIDVVKREFAWVYRYAREAQTPAEARAVWQNATQNQIVRVNDRWLDSAAVVAEGHVFLTPPESAELHCLDLHSGKLAWKHRQGDSLFIAGVANGCVLLVGAESVQAVRISDGAAAWPQELVALPTGALPAGHGYVSDGDYYLPLTSGEIAEIEIASGKITRFSAAKPDVALGNLICHRGSVLSQSALVLDKYEQLDVLQQRAEAALARNPDDATALRELAELKRADGHTPEAVKLLKRAAELAPADPLAQEMLAEVLLEALASDYATFRDNVPLLAGLIHDRQQQIELLRIEARGLDKLGQRLPAFDAYVRLADFTAEDPAYLRIGPSYSVRSDRWIRGRLATLWTSATADERATISARLAERRPQLDHPRTAAELRHYLVHLDQLPGASEVRRALAAFLIDRGRVQEAELELLEMSDSADNETQGAAADLISKLTAEDADEKDRSGVPWPRGEVDAEFVPAAARAEPREARAQVERQAGYRQLRVEQDVSLGAAATQWFVSTDCSELVGRNMLGDDVFHLTVDQNSWARQYRDSSLVHAARLGRLLFVALGGQIMAIDSRRGALGSDGDVLWQTDPLGRYSSASLHERPNAATAPARTSRRPVYHASSGRKRMTGAGMCSLGPVTPRGVVFQEQEHLKCVDPLSGELLWMRTDIPAGCELFGDAELVFAADAGGRVAHVIRTIDGRLVGKRELPNFEWLLTAGRNVAELGFQMSLDNRVLLLRISDIYSQAALYESEFPLASRTTVVEPHAIAVYEPSGRFQVIDARSGQEVIDQPLEVVADAQAIHTMRLGDQLFLFISSQPNQQYKSLIQQSDYPLVNGLVYAFNLKSGKPLWESPAVVRNRGILLSQPEEIPLLVFADRKMVRDATTGGGSQLRLLCLDRETGETVYRNDSLLDTAITRFRVRGKRAEAPIVAVEMSAGKIQLTMTDRPRSPQSPANDDREPPRESAEQGLREIGRRLSGALQSALENQPAENPPAKQAVGDTDTNAADDD